MWCGGGQMVKLVREIVIIRGVWFIVIISIFIRLLFLHTHVTPDEATIRVAIRMGHKRAFLAPLLPDQHAVLSILF